VFNPYRNELFHAEAGQRSLPQRQTHLCSSRSLPDGLVSFGTSPYDKDKSEATFSRLNFYMKNSWMYSRSGSAALDICYVACGRFELYYEMSLSPWDYAAAS
jgi:myo-inositol-1(or 4)-monophosphatase